MNKKIILTFIIVIFVFLIFPQKSFARFGTLQFHTSTASDGSYSDRSGVTITVSGDGPDGAQPANCKTNSGLSYNDGWWSSNDRTCYSCVTHAIFDGSRFYQSISLKTGNDGWTGRYGDGRSGFAACHCHFKISLPGGANGSWSRWTGTSGCGVWSGDNNCYRLLTYGNNNWIDDTRNFGFNNDQDALVYYDWCENECSYETQYRCNGNTLEKRECGYYDKDTCYDWSGWEEVKTCSSGYTNDYRCSGSNCQRKYITRICSVNFKDCTESPTWITQINCGTTTNWSWSKWQCDSSFNRYRTGTRTVKGCDETRSPRNCSGFCYSYTESKTETQNCKDGCCKDGNCSSRIPLCNCDTPEIGERVSASLVNCVRNSINSAESAAGKSNTKWTPPHPMTSGEVIKAIHITEMCNAVKSLKNYIGLNVNLTCQSVNSGDIIRRSHFLDIINDLNSLANAYNTSYCRPQ